MHEVTSYVKRAVCMYRKVLTFLDRFMALCFTATGAPSAARRIRILPVNQYA
jgi:hypothetical protein